jgi:hypothetical protein
MPAIMQDLITPGRVTAAEIAHALGARRVGQNRWMARCPAHRERTPSLSIAEGRDGRALVHCFGGCEQTDVIAALRGRGLWSANDRRSYTLAERRAYFQQCDTDQFDFGEARWWRMGAAMLADLALEEMPPTDSGRADITHLVKITGNDRATLAEYRAWRDEYPRFTTALVKAGRAYDERSQLRLARILTRDVEDGAWE